jgi:hypothetical protein
VFVALVLSLWFAERKGDRRYLIMFAGGAIFQAWMEYSLQRNALRGAGYSLSVFGATLPAMLRPIFQGFAEGGLLSVMAFWFVDLRTDQNRRRAYARIYFAVCALIVILATIVGIMSVNEPITSPRPMFIGSRAQIIGIYVAGSILLCWWRGGLRYLAYFYLGLLIYIILTFEPLHILGARYIGVREGEQVVTASFAMQVLIMGLSHLWEVAGGKVHYFAVPFALGLVKIRGGSNGRYESVPA